MFLLQSRTPHHVTSRAADADPLAILQAIDDNGAIGRPMLITSQHGGEVVVENRSCRRNSDAADLVAQLARPESGKGPEQC